MERPETSTIQIHESDDVQEQEITEEIVDQAQEEAAGQAPEIAVEVAPEIIIVAVEAPETTINTTIVRLPMYMQEANKGLFEPRVISIGPYHFGQRSTLDMEAHKDRFHRDFFLRLGNHVNHQDLTALCTKRAMQCYSGSVSRLYTSEKLMRDGCFIIELLIQWEEGEKAHVDDHMRLMSNSIYYDLLIVDNQVPFFLLTRIYEEFKRYNRENPVVLNNPRLVNLIINFFNHNGQFSWAYSYPPDQYPSNADHRHLLEIQYSLVIRWNISSNNNNDEQAHYASCLCGLCSNNTCRKSPMPLGIPGANELQDYGVTFHLKENQQTDMFDVTFSCKTMSIPHFKINFGSKILLANLFAYDQIASQSAAGVRTIGPPGSNNNVGAVTSYVALMNALINTKKDVMVLQREGILDNLLSNEEEVASFFNRLGRCALVDVSNHRYTGMFEDVNRYWRYGCCCKHFVTFRMKHCRNPWTCLSLMGAILLLCISLISMMYTILQYYNRRH